jgi:hypothetical protein
MYLKDDEDENRSPRGKNLPVQFQSERASKAENGFPEIFIRFRPYFVLKSLLESLAKSCTLGLEQERLVLWKLINLEQSMTLGCKDVEMDSIKYSDSFIPSLVELVKLGTVEIVEAGGVIAACVDVVHALSSIHCIQYTAFYFERTTHNERLHDRGHVSHHLC